MHSPEPPLGAAWHAIHVHTAVVWIPLGGAAGFSDSSDQACLRASQDAKRTLTICQCVDKVLPDSM